MCFGGLASLYTQVISNILQMQNQEPSNTFGINWRYLMVFELALAQMMKFRFKFRQKPIHISFETRSLSSLQLIKLQIK